MIDEKSIGLEELFPQADGSGSAGDCLPFEGLHQNTAAKIAGHLGLAFISDPLIDSSEVCQANTEGVLPAYRTAVTAREIFYYLVAMLENRLHDRDTIPYPSGPEVFWKLVERGTQLAKNSGQST